MSVFGSSALRWLNESRLGWRLIAPLIMFGVIILFVREDVNKRRCTKACVVQGYAKGAYVGGDGDGCVCVDSQGKHVTKSKSNQE